MENLKKCTAYETLACAILEYRPPTSFKHHVCKTDIGTFNKILIRHIPLGKKRGILNLVFGLLDGEPKSIKEVAARYKINANEILLNLSESIGKIRKDRDACLQIDVLLNL